MSLILDFLFPPRCEGCGKLGCYICAKCADTIVLRGARCPECDRMAIDGMTHPVCQRAQGLDGLISVFAYSGVIKKVLKTIKYRFVHHEAESLINLIPKDLWILLKRHFSNFVIYPVPLHEDRLKWRGFNQAEKLAEFISVRLQLPVAEGLLIRSEKRTPQADISHRQDRIKNAKGLFGFSSILKSQYPSILLIDDVWTTGATMKEAAKVLKRNGAAKVWAITMAR